MSTRSFFVFIISLLILATLSGCVRRRMTVRSNPPGATVYLDGKEIGRTPFSTNFTFYGKREFRVVKQGYETLTKIQPVRAPWYEWIGLDFVSEVILPGKLTDQKFYEFDLQPSQEVAGAEIVARAEQLRQTAHQDGIPQTAVPLPSAVPAQQTMPLQPNAGSITPPSFAPIFPPQ